MEHPDQKKYTDQKIYVIYAKEYVYLVLFVTESNGNIFLKTIIPSCKAEQKYIEEKNYEKKKKIHQKELDNEEKELLESFENDEWKSVKNLEKEKKHARKVAGKTLRKDVRINIRLSSNDVSNIKQLAAYEGLPYQTLIASILHKYAAGHP